MIKSNLFIDQSHHLVESEDTLNEESCLDWVKEVKTVINGNESLHSVTVHRDESQKKWNEQSLVQRFTMKNPLEDTIVA